MIRTVVSNLFKQLLVGIILINLIFSMDASAKQHRPQQDIRALIEQAKDAWVARNADALAQLFAPDGELIVPGQRWRGQARIREEISKFAQQYTDVSIEIRRVVVDGNQAAVEWHYQDTEKATGKCNQADDAIVLEVKDGRLSYWREYFDTETPAKQS